MSVKRQATKWEILTIHITEKDKYHMWNLEDGINKQQKQAY